MAVSARSQLLLAAYHRLQWTSILHTAALNYTQKVIRFSSFTGLSTCRVTCRANAPFTCLALRNRSKHAFIFLVCLLSSYQQISWVMTGRLALMRPTGNRSRDLGCLELPSGPPCPPPLVKQKRNAEGPPLTLVRAVTHSAAASLLTSSWLKYPPRPAALPPPSCSLPSLPPYFICWFISFHHRLFP